MTTPTLKTCTKCLTEKDLSEFGPSKLGKLGKTSYCRKCLVERAKTPERAQYMREYAKKNRARINVGYSTRYRKDPKKFKYRRMKKEYGLSREEYDRLVAKAGGKCEMCGTPEEELFHGLSVDHDHDTKVVRGLLCVRCNAGLGGIGDNMESLLRAMKYLMKTQPQLVHNVSLRDDELFLPDTGLLDPIRVV